MDDRPKFAVPSAKTGTGPDALFGLGPFLCIGDPYKDPLLRAKIPPRLKDDDRQVFKPPGPIAFPLSDYPAFTSQEVVEPKKELQIIRGVYPSAYLGHRPFPEYMPDDYDAAWKIASAERKAVRAKLADVPPFRVAAPGLLPFSPPSEVFYADKPRGGCPLPRFKFPASDRAPFRPSGGEPNIVGGKFPEHMPDPLVSRKKEVRDSDRPNWRDASPMNVVKQAPSIIFNTTNLRKQHPAVFRRRMYPIVEISMFLE